MSSKQRLSYSLHIQANHYDEWVDGSAVSPLITELNVRSLSIPEEIDELLNRNLKNTWGGSWKHGSGWSVTGVDPETGEPVYDGAQFKPDVEVQVVQDGLPKFKRNGEPDTRKYFNASKCESEPLFLDTGDVDFWPNVKAEVTKRILIGEGAKKAGAALTLGEAFISIPGVSNGQRKGRLKKKIEMFCTPGREIVICFDSDQHYNRNVTRELNKLGSLLKNKGVLVKVLMLPRDTKGVDDFIVLYGGEAFKELVNNALTFEEWREEYFLHPDKEVKTISSNLPDIEDNYQLKAQAALFSDRPWVCIDGSLYEWAETHYARRSEAAIKHRISKWCADTPVWSNGEWRYAYATATNVDNIYAWVQRAFAIDPDTVNPPGVNCLNGTLKISWQGVTPRWELVKHDPSIVYTYVGGCEYNPDADPTACDRLLACLDAPEREIFIKTLAASLDLNAIRRLRGRSIRALLCKGDGNNGKDSLREAVSVLYGIGVVSATVTDGLLYDQGKKFPFAKLEHARISWSSENSSFGSLDAIQGYKAAITGETIYIEHKCVDERPINPSTVFFFNINNVPNLQASLEAIQSRWAVLSFNKTFKINANPARGELEADPRFRYDPDFLKIEVVPALLNKMLAALPEVAMKAIDYNCTESAMQEIQEETNHLWAFAREVGLGYQVGGRVYINDLWEQLKQWYLDNGTLVIIDDGKKQKNDWHDPRRGDKAVRAANQVYARFRELFPKVRKEQESGHHPTHPRAGVLLGIGFGVMENTSSPQLKQPTVSPSEYLENVGIENFLSSLSPDYLQQIKSKIENLPSQPSQPGLENNTAFPTPFSMPSYASTLPSHNAIASAPHAVASSPNVNASAPESTATASMNVDNSQKNLPVANNYKFRVGDRVLIDFPGSKRHGKVGEVLRLKEWEGVPMADIRLPDEPRAWEAQVAFLRPIPPKDEQTTLFSN